MVNEAHTYRFSDLLLDPANRRLTRGGTEIYLPPKTFDTLVILVQRHGRLVTKQALLDAVWTDTAVTDNALTQRVSDLREALGDDAHQPRFIRTLPRVGFTFIAQVEGSTPQNSSRNAAWARPCDGSTPEAKRLGGPQSFVRAVGQRVRTDRQLALAGLALTLAVGWAAWWLARPSTQSAGWSWCPPSPVCIVHRVFHRTEVWWSSSATRVAHRKSGRGTSAGGDPIQITSHEDPAARPRWSAQGDQIVYSVQGKGVWSVAPFGAKPRQLVDVGWNPDLSQDGRQLVFERRWEIWTANADGTSQRRLPTIRLGYLAYFGDAWPTFSPDGKQIALFLGEKGPNGDYWIVPTEAGEPQRLTFDVAEGGAPAWTPDGKHLVVSSARTGSVTLWRVPIAGGAPVALTAGAGGISILSFHPMANGYSLPT